jgi:hypothetical protein
MKRVFSLFVGLFIVVFAGYADDTITYKNPLPGEAVTLSITNRIIIRRIDTDSFYWQASDTGSLKIVLQAGNHNILVFSRSVEK